jgi:hypothetical protein
VGKGQGDGGEHRIVIGLSAGDALHLAVIA